MSIIGLMIISFLVAGIVGPLAAIAGQRYERRRIERALLARAGWKGVDGLTPEMSRSSPSLDTRTGAGRMEDLERSIDAVALELERLGEGQRFLTKLLGERKGEATEKR